MARNDYDDDDNFEDDSNAGIASLRDALKKANKRVKELETENTGLQSFKKSTSVKSYLAEKGLRPSLARWIERDDVDPSDASALDQWVEDNREDFNITLPTPTADDGNTSEQNPFERMNQSAAQGARGGDATDALARIGSMSPEELTAYVGGLTIPS